MTPFFFGESDRPLFGAYSAPASDRGIDSAGVLLCYPVWLQYMRAYWAFRRLATMLSGRGLHVLRFDYACCGDSAGEATDASFAEWQDNVVTAAQELTDMSGAKTVCLLGCQLGAALAAGASPRIPNLKHVILWDPVFGGADCLDAFNAIQSDMLKRRRWRTDADGSDGAFEEILGYRVSNRLRDEVMRVGPEIYAQCSAREAFVIGSSPNPKYREITDLLAACGCKVHYRVAEEHEETWEELAFTARAHVEPALLRTLAGTFCEEET